MAKSFVAAGMVWMLLSRLVWPLFLLLVQSSGKEALSSPQSFTSLLLDEMQTCSGGRLSCDMAFVAIFQISIY